MSLFTELTNTVNIPSQFSQRTHPMPPLDDNGTEPVETNKFYGNMLLDDRTLYAYPQPYSVWWTGTSSGFVGLGISHQDASARVFGPDSSANPVQYFYSPSGVMNMCLSASWGGTPTFSTNSWGPMSVNAVLTQGSGKVVYPLCNGMGFVTAVYTGIAPKVSSQVGFKSVGTATMLRSGLTRLNVTLEDSTVWSIYITLPSGGQATLTQSDSQNITVNSTESGVVVQVAKLGGSTDDWQAILDSAGGAYPTQVALDGGLTSDYKTAVYSFQYQLAGSSTGGGTLLYAAPHHVASFTSTMDGKVTSLYLNSPTLGMLRLCVATELEMYERLPVNIGFLPWSQQKQAGDANFSYSNFTGTVTSLIQTVSEDEISGVDISSATNLSSMYFSGKLMSKYANILLVLTYITQDTSLATQLLASLKTAYAVFVNNTQQTPLFYDLSWKGLVSTAGISDSGADFGNTYYNDHHFHYGYFIHAAAIIAKCDQELASGTWIQDTTNTDWVNSLIRDVATFGDDETYPQSRMFDWYSGHGLAKGLFTSADGKDEESSSEDYNCWYGMKLWGNVLGDKSLESRGNLILAIEARAMNHYMLYETDNTTEPSNYIGNFVSGIKFENKIDHTTYFGTNLEYIQGIHMIPITPISSLIRSPTFVNEEWQALLASIIGSVNSGWKGILYLNYALYDPQTAYDFFASSSFSSTYLDDGLSRTWALAFSCALLS